MTKKSESYQSIFYVSPYLYVSEESDKSMGRILLYMFSLSRTRELAEVSDVSQKYIQIVRKTPFKDTAIIGSHEIDCPIWADSIGSLSQKSSIFFVGKMVPENFWFLDKGFVDILMEKLTTSALSTILGLSHASMNTVALEAALDFSGSSGSEPLLFKRYAQLPIVKMQRVQEPKK